MRTGSKKTWRNLSCCGGQACYISSIYKKDLCHNTKSTLRTTRNHCQWLARLLS